MTRFGAVRWTYLWWTLLTIWWRFRRCRETIIWAAQISRFRQILSCEVNARARREACVQLAVYLEAVERNKFDFDGFDESFFRDDREDEDEDV